MDVKEDRGDMLSFLVLKKILVISLKEIEDIDT